MKRFLKYLLVVSILMVTFTFLPVSGNAQEPGCDPDNMRCGDPDCTFKVWCPIDNGLILLLAIGALYGVKKVRDARKEESMGNSEG